MCYFEYKKFDSCRHYGIVVNDICDEVLWRAGLAGQLRLCVPSILERSLEWSGPDHHEPPKPASFAGYDGFCEMCVETFKLPCSITRRSYSDHKLDYSRQLNYFNPDDSAPYLLFVGLTALIPELLGVADQFEAARLKQGPCMIFHNSLEQRTWSGLRNLLPFTYKGVFEADYTLGIEDALERLNIKEGITRFDRDQSFTLFKARGMPLGHFTTVIVDKCRPAVPHVQVQMARVVREPAQQCSEDSDDSTLTTLTKTPSLSDVEQAELKVSSQAPEFPEGSKYDGSSLSHHSPEDHQMLHVASEGQQASATKLASSAIPPSRGIRAPLDGSTKVDASIVQGLVMGDSSYQLYENEIEVAPAQGQDLANGGRILRISAYETQYEQRITVERPRRMAIAEQVVDERTRRLRLLDQASNNPFRPAFDNAGTSASKALTDHSRTMRAAEKTTSGNIGQGPQHEQEQQREGTSQGSGDGSPSKTPYHKAGKTFKWKALETPGYKRTRRATNAGGTREQQARNRQDHQQLQQPQSAQQPQMPPQPQTAQQLPAKRLSSRAQRQVPSSNEAVLIQDDSDEDLAAQESVPGAAQLQTHLDPSTVRRLQDSGLLGKTRRR
ncbi:hypothetical protein Daus18300_001601 [Diaporthe australafricana]|uniref:Uncharacterized protein n=1 Tax=Diaporthe australafricana TaxID=127596 RepID=A0ABR3XVK3_9PEZI